MNAAWQIGARHLSINCPDWCQSTNSMIWQHNEHDRFKSKHPVSRNVNSISFACLSWCFFLMHSLNVNLISFACLSWRKPPTDLRLMSPQQQDYVQGPASGFWKTRFPKKEEESGNLFQRGPICCGVELLPPAGLVRVVRQVRQELVGNQLVGGRLQVLGQVNHLCGKGRCPLRL